MTRDSTIFYLYVIPQDVPVNQSIYVEMLLATVSGLHSEWVPSEMLCYTHAHVHGLFSGIPWCLI